MKRIPHRIIAAVSAIALSLPTVLSIYGGNDAYDINGDGSIDTKDLVRLMKNMAGTEIRFPTGLVMEEESVKKPRIKTRLDCQARRPA